MLKPKKIGTMVASKTGQYRWYLYASVNIVLLTLLGCTRVVETLFDCIVFLDVFIALQRLKLGEVLAFFLVTYCSGL